MKLSIRIRALQWADLLVVYTLFVMQNYLTDVWKLSFTHAAAILNIWRGISMVLPVFSLFLADALLGNFTMLVISSITYSVGIGLVTMSTPPVLANSTGTCKQYEPECIGHTQKVLFYTGMAFVAVGAASQRACSFNFIGEQIESHYVDINIMVRRTFFMGIAYILPAIGIFAFPYIKQWVVLFGVSAIFMSLATILFLAGSCAYNKAQPQGSPLTAVCRVFVAAAFKKSQPFPADTKQLYYKDGEGLNSFPRSRFLRCLEKAAIILPDVSLEDQVKNRWRLCSVDEVEAAKIAVRMVPMWTTFVICAIVSSTGDTYFVEQGSRMNRKLGKWKVPSQVLLALFFLGKQLFGILAERIAKTLKIYGAPIGIGVAMIFSILCCISAAKVEMWRLKVIKNHGLFDKSDKGISMSAYWLFFQFFLLAGLDSFFRKSVDAFYGNESPVGMREFLSYFDMGVAGLGYMCSVLSVYVVGKISEIGGKTSWFQYTLNRSRLDRYYWVLAALSSVNLVVFILVASCYRYKNPREEDIVSGVMMKSADDVNCCCG